MRRPGSTSATSARALTKSSEENDISERWQTLLGATLEATFHLLLYVRRVYPRGAFDATRFLGVRCHVCRHPAVSAYIQDFVQITTEALLGEKANEIVFTIIDRGIPVERYRLEVRGLQKFVVCSVTEDVLEITDHLERNMRDLIIQVHAIPIECTHWSSTATFRLSVHLQSNPDDKNTPKLHKALHRGAWFSSPMDSPPNTLCPLYTANIPTGTMNFFREICVNNEQTHTSDKELDLVDK